MFLLNLLSWATYLIEITVHRNIDCRTVNLNIKVCVLILLLSRPFTVCTYARIVHEQSATWSDIKDKWVD